MQAVSEQEKPSKSKPLSEVIDSSEAIRRQKEEFDALLKIAYPGIQSFTQRPIGLGSSARSHKFQRCLEIDPEKTIALLHLFQFTEQEKKDYLLLAIRALGASAIQQIRYFHIHTPELIPDLIDQSAKTNYQAVLQQFNDSAYLFTDYEFRLCKSVASKIRNLSELPPIVKTFPESAQTSILKDLLVNLFEQTVNNLSEFKFNAKELADHIKSEPQLHTISNYKLLLKAGKAADFGADDMLAQIALSDGQAFLSQLHEFSEADYAKKLAAAKIALGEHGFFQEDGQFSIFDQLGQCFKAEDLPDLHKTAAKGNACSALAVLTARQALTEDLEKELIPKAIIENPVKVFELRQSLSLSEVQLAEIVKGVLSTSYTDAREIFVQIDFKDSRLSWQCWQEFYNSDAEASVSGYLEFKLPKDLDQGFFDFIHKKFPSLLTTIFSQLLLQDKDSCSQQLFTQLKKEDLFLACKNVKLLGITAQKTLEELANRAIEQSATKTLGIFADLGIESIEFRRQSAKKCFSAQSWLTIENIEAFKLGKDDKVYKECFLAVLESNPYKLLAMISDLQSEPAELQAATIKACLNSSYNKFTENAEKFKDCLQALCNVISTEEQVSAEKLLQLCTLFKIEHDPAVTGKLICRLNTSGLKKIDLYLQHGLEDQDLLESLIFEHTLNAYDRDSWKDFLTKYLERLQITDLELQKRIALRLVDCLYTSTPENLSCLGLSSTDPQQEKELEEFRLRLALNVIEKEFAKSDQWPELSASIKFLDNFMLSDHGPLIKELLPKVSNCSDYITHLGRLKLQATADQTFIRNNLIYFVYTGKFKKPATKSFKTDSAVQNRAQLVINNLPALRNIMAAGEINLLVQLLIQDNASYAAKNIKQVVHRDPADNDYIWKALGKSLPEETLALAAEHGCTNQSVYTLIRRFLAKNSPEKAVAGISLQIHKPGYLMLVALSVGRQNFAFLKANYIRFGIKDDELSAQILEKLEAEKKCVAAENIEFFGITSDKVKYRLIATTAASDIKKAIKYANLNRITEQSEFLQTAFRESLNNNNLSNAVEIALVYSKHSGNQTDPFSSLKHFLDRTSALPNLPKHIERQIGLLQRAVNARAWPEEYLLKAFELFDDNTDTFISQILGTAGSTFGAQIIQELLKIYATQKKGQEVSISQEDQSIIMLFVSNKFRGFSKETFVSLKEKYNQTKSLDTAKRTLKEWQDISSSILRGEKISAQMSSNSFFPLYVLAAYKPVGMSLDDVKRILPTVSDNSQHLEKFSSIPQDGYLLTMRDLTNLQLVQGKELNAGMIADFNNTLSTCSNMPVTAEEFNDCLLSLANPGASQLNIEQFLAYLISHSSDQRVKPVIDKISAFQSSSEPSLPAYYEILGQLSDFFNALEEDIIEEVLHKHISDKKINLQDGLSQQITDKLQLPKQATSDIISAYLLDAASKIIAQYQQSLHSEFKKFVREFSGAESEYRIYISKSKAAYFGRAGAGLCTAQENWSWNNKDFLQMIMVDTDKSIIVGNIQLHLFKGPDGKPSVLARLNPTSQFLNHAPRAILAEQMLKAVHQFADDHQLTVFMPEQSSWHQLTNRTEFSTFLMAYFGTAYNMSVRLTESQYAGRIYRSTYPEKK